MPTLKITSSPMAYSNDRTQKLALTGVLALLGTICIVGIGILDGAYEDRISSETEEAKELTECDDVEQLFAIVDHEVELIHGHGFDEWLNTVQASPLLSHSWRWCSRGPPAK